MGFTLHVQPRPAQSLDAPAHLLHLLRFMYAYLGLLEFCSDDDLIVVQLSLVSRPDETNHSIKSQGFVPVGLGCSARRNEGEDESKFGE